MLYTRFDTSPSLATLTKFNGSRISINRSEGTCPQNHHSPAPPIPFAFFVTRHSVISFRGKLWVQAISHACPSQRFLDKASILLYNILYTYSIYNNQGSPYWFLHVATLQFPQFTPKPLDIFGVLHLAVIWKLLTELGQELAQELLVCLRTLSKEVGKQYFRVTDK
jgi:hypothetical protein